MEKYVLIGDLLNGSNYGTAEGVNICRKNRQKIRGYKLCSFPVTSHNWKTFFNMERRGSLIVKYSLVYLWICNKGRIRNSIDQKIAMAGKNSDYPEALAHRKRR